MKVIPATPDGALEDVRVIAFHGHLHADATPARSGPIYVDADNCMLRIVSANPAAHGFDVMVEIAPPPLPEAGELPGYATRVGPWQARLEHQIIVLGPSEIERVDRLKHRSELVEPPAVERFVRWLMSGQDCSDSIPCQRLKDAAVWYCSKQETFALFHRIHRIVEDEYFEAARFFRSGHPRARRRLEDASWWLSRAMIGKEDIYRAAAALRRVGSTSWRTMLREGLRLPKETEWEEGLRDADRLLDDPPAPVYSAPRVGPTLASARSKTKQLFMTPDSSRKPVSGKEEAA